MYNNASPYCALLYIRARILQLSRRYLADEQTMRRLDHASNGASYTRVRGWPASRGSGDDSAVECEREQRADDEARAAEFECERVAREHAINLRRRGRLIGYAHGRHSYTYTPARGTRAEMCARDGGRGSLTWSGLSSTALGAVVARMRTKSHEHTTRRSVRVKNVWRGRGRAS